MYLYMYYVEYTLSDTLCIDDKDIIILPLDGQ